MIKIRVYSNQNMILYKAIAVPITDIDQEYLAQDTSNHGF